MHRRGSVSFEPSLSEKLGVENVVAMAQQPCSGFEIGTRHAQNLTYVPHCRANTIANDICNHRGTASSVLRIDVLNYFFTTVVLDVEIDVWGLGALDAQEPFEQEVHPNRINRGDPETKAHCTALLAALPRP